MNEERLLRILRRCWSRDTSTKWTPEAPASGQCGVTALVAQDLIGGEIAKTRVGGDWHFYNMIGGRRVDFTVEQFSERIEYSDTTSSRDDAFTDATAQQYQNLSNRVREMLMRDGEPDTENASK